MTEKAFLGTHEEIAISITENIPYDKVEPKKIRENNNVPIAGVIAKMINEKGQKEALKAVSLFSNTLKSSSRQFLPDIKEEAIKEIGYVQQEESFEQRLIDRLNNKNKSTNENKAGSGLKPKFSSN